MNLLDETKKIMSDHDLTADNICFIGSQESGYFCSWDEFEVLAFREYNRRYGWAHVASDLVIIFDNGYKLRRVYAWGGERWEYIQYKKKKIKSVFGYSFLSSQLLNQINRDY